SALVCIDEDGDGYTADVDCNDSDASVNPGAVDYCDADGNFYEVDCNADTSLVCDEYCGDLDSDTFVTSEKWLEWDSLHESSCPWVVGGNDCDDNNAEIFPGAVEDCDGVDNNCDGVIDEGCESLICSQLTEAVNYVQGGYADDCQGIQPGPKQLKVVDSSCNPIANVRVNLRTESNSYITYKRTNADGIVDFSDYQGGAVPSKFEVDYHGARYKTPAGSYDTGDAVQTREYHLKFLGSDCNPIANARVNLRTASNSYVTYKRTNSEGIASFEVVPEAQMKLEVDYHGARWRSEANTADVDVLLGAEAFKLTLIDSNENPIPNARVNLRTSSNSYVTYTRTNSDGLASFDVLPGGALKFEVDYHGARYRTETSTTHEPETVQTKSFGLLLIDSQGNPISNARVNLRTSSGSYVTYTRTNSEGVASFEVVPGAEMLLEVDYHGARYRTDVTTVNDNTQLTVNTYRLTMVLTDSNDNPIENARVNLRTSSGSYVMYKRTDSDGRAPFEVVPDACMKLEVDYNGAQYMTNVTCVTADTEVPMQLPVEVEVGVQTNAFSLKLIDSSDNPIANARVNLRTSSGSYVTYTRTNSEGIASFETVPEAQMMFEVDYHGARYRTDVLDVDSNPLTTVQTKAFSLLLKDSSDNPIANARVNLRTASGSYVTYARTNSDGVASFEVVPGAEMLLEVDYHGARYRTDVTTVNDNTQLTMQTKAFALKLLDSSDNPIANARVNLRTSSGSYVTYTRT
ncbi:MAG: hypothetical protein DRP09_20635, partial [Candidatus Thorarchaeota archaeon]